MHVDPHAGAELQRQDLGEVDDRRLGGVVDADGGVAPQPANRRHVDDARRRASRIHARQASWVHTKAPRTFTWNVLSQAPRSASMVRAHGGVGGGVVHQDVEARRAARCVRCHARRGLVGLARVGRERGQARARTRSRGSRRRPRRGPPACGTTASPRRRRRRRPAAIARPMPFDAPVTSATLPPRELMRPRTGSLARRRWEDVRSGSTGPASRPSTRLRDSGTSLRSMASGRSRSSPCCSTTATRLDPGRLPRRRRVLRDQRLPDHVPAARRLARARTASARAVLAAAGPAACSRRCSPCSASSSLYALLFLPDDARPAARRGRSPRSSTSRTGSSIFRNHSYFAERRVARRCCSTCGRSRWRSSSTCSGR